MCQVIEALQNQDGMDGQKRGTQSMAALQHHKERIQDMSPALPWLTMISITAVSLLSGCHTFLFPPPGRGWRFHLCAVLSAIASNEPNIWLHAVVLRCLSKPF